MADHRDHDDERAPAVQAAFDRAQALMSEGRFTDLETHLRAACKRFPGEPELTLWLAQRLIDSDRDEALTLVVVTAEAFREDVAVVIRAAGLLVDADAYAEAAPWVAQAKALSDDPAHWATLELFDGCLLAADGDVGPAEHALRRSYAADPTLDYGARLARFLYQRGRWREALDISERGLALGPSPREVDVLRDLRDWLVEHLDAEPEADG